LEKGVYKAGELKYIFEEFGPIDAVEIIGRK
jgi:hypothetical protein